MHLILLQFRNQIKTWYVYVSKKRPLASVQFLSGVFPVSGGDQNYPIFKFPKTFPPLGAVRSVLFFQSFLQIILYFFFPCALWSPVLFLLTSKFITFISSLFNVAFHKLNFSVCLQKIRYIVPERVHTIFHATLHFLHPPSPNRSPLQPKALMKQSLNALPFTENSSNFRFCSSPFISTRFSQLPLVRFLFVVTTLSSPLGNL